LGLAKPRLQVANITFQLLHALLHLLLIIGQQCCAY
jgi:hypothetical protein